MNAFKLFWLQKDNITVGTLNKSAYHFVVPWTPCHVEHTTPLLLFLSYLRHVTLPPHSTQLRYCTNHYVAALEGLWRRQIAPVPTRRQKSRVKVDLLTEKSIVKLIPSEPLKPFFTIRNVCICAAERIYST